MAFSSFYFEQNAEKLITKKEDVIKYDHLYYYCNNHRTIKKSEKLDKNGNKMKINLCDSKIKYDKLTNKYIFCKDHTDDCNNIEKAQITSIAEVNKEIKNYENYIQKH